MEKNYKVNDDLTLEMDGKVYRLTKNNLHICTHCPLHQIQGCGELCGATYYGAAETPSFGYNDAIFVEVTENKETTIKKDEIDYKALYEETISKLKIAKENVGYYTFSEVIDKVIPEVAESDDERTRNEIIAFVEQSIHRGGGTPIPEEQENKWLAWFEKQKTTEESLRYLKENHSPSEMSDFQAAMNIAVAKAYNKGYADGLEKQGERKPADKVESISKDDEDESIIKDIIAYMRYERKSTEEEIENRFIPWLEKQGERKEIDYNEELKKCRANPLYFFDKYVKVKLNERKPADKVEPKFNVGDWVVSPNGVYWHIDTIRNDRYQVSSNLGNSADWPLNTNIYHKFTIQDAKDGDVLVAKIDKEPNDFIYIFYEYDKNGFWSHCYLDAYINKFHEGIYHNNHNVGVPATQEQRDLLFQKMKEAGYEWDEENKVLRKIGQKSKENTKFYDSMDDLIADGLIEEIENSELDDKSKHNRIFWIKSHRQKPAWSEEDKENISMLIDLVESKEESMEVKIELSAWLKSIKEKMQPQPKPTWSEEDERMKRAIFETIIHYTNPEGLKEYDNFCSEELVNEMLNWLKSLKDRTTLTNKNDFDRGYDVGISAAKFNQWKPTEEQMESIARATNRCISVGDAQVLLTLYEDLKKL